MLPFQIGRFQPQLFIYQVREASNEQRMKLFPILLAGLTFAQDELQAWEQFDIIEDDVAEIEQDLKDYQQVGICGSPSVSPNDWLFQNKFKRSTDDEDEDNEHSSLAGYETIYYYFMKLKRMFLQKPIQ